MTGWLLAPRETADLAKRLLGGSIHKQHVTADQLTIHADRGTSMGVQAGGAVAVQSFVYMSCGRFPRKEN